MRRFRTSLNCAGCLALLAACLGAPADSPAQASSDDLDRARGIVVNDVRNERPAFMVRLAVDHPDRVYREGELVRATVRSEKAGYLYLIYLDAEGKMVRLLPNRVEDKNFIPAGKDVIVPPTGAGYRLEVVSPYGKELLKAIVSLEPLDPNQVARMVSPEGVRSVAERMKSRAPEWAEHHVTVETRPASDVSPPDPTRRVGVFIGISDFEDPGIRDLKVGDADANAMADAMERACHFKTRRLLGSQATLSNIENAIRRWLPEATRPGDVVVIYWSGHGARCADEDGEEKDGLDEYLVPYDGRWADPTTIKRTMLLDDTFGRWIQELDGRKVMVILDTCHSGGQSEQAKGLGELPTLPAGTEFDFLDGEMERAKDIGQRETALLASSLATQVSFERTERDLSVMTYFLVQQLNRSSGSLTLDAAFENLKREVADYVELAFPGSTQTPFLIDNMTPPFYLRP